MGALASLDVTAALQGFLTCLGLIVAIGAQNAFVLRQGVRREHVPTVVVLCAAADAILISAGVAGLGPLVAANHTALAIVRWAGAAFLGVMAVMAAARALRGAQALRPAEDGAGSRAAAVGACLAFTFLNPHVYLDMVLLGSLAGRHGDGRWAFAVGAAAASAAWFTALGFGAGRLRPVFARPAAWRVLDGAIAAVMGGLAVGLAVAG